MHRRSSRGLRSDFCVILVYFLYMMRCGTAPDLIETEILNQDDKKKKELIIIQSGRCIGTRLYCEQL